MDNSYIAINETFDSFDKYHEFESSLPDALSYRTERDIRKYACSFGTETELFGHISKERTTAASGDLREGLISGGTNSRQRALGYSITQYAALLGIPNAKLRIVGHQDSSLLAEAVSARYPLFTQIDALGLSDGAQPALCAAVDNLRGSFADIIFSSDVLNLSPRLDGVLESTAQSLVDGGFFLATLPFAWDSRTGWVFAEMIDGKIVHHLPQPIYHGHPYKPDETVLVYELPGWSILDRARYAGFETCEISLICNQQMGITASFDGRPLSPRGVFILKCRK